MRIAFFDTHRFDRRAFEAAPNEGQSLTFIEARLTAETASLAAGHEAVCAFVNDRVDEKALTTLAGLGVRLVALRSAGFNNVELEAAARLRITVVRVPEYSPHAVAEHAVALVLSLNRHIPKAHARVRDWNFALDGLVGFDLFGKTVGIVGTGRIGSAAARIFRGFGCTVLGHDVVRDESLAREGVRYVDLPELFRASDVISLHVPLLPQTKHLIDADAFAQMKRSVMLINTSRGGLVDSRALLDALKSGRIASAGLDVYEEEEGIFFRDLSESMLGDDVLARLITFPNVLVTSHQAFLTAEALHNIAQTTLRNVAAFERGDVQNEVRRPVTGGGRA